MTILPTHSCFDDAAHFVGKRFAEDQQKALDTLTLVHAIVTHPVQLPRPFAHAWVEEQTPEGILVWQAGLLEDERRVEFAVTPEEHAKELQIHKAVRYTIQEAVRQDLKESSGPWDPEIKARCKRD